MSEPHQCLNCQAKVTGQYCGQCGQRLLGAKSRSMSHLLLSSFAEISSVDSRLWRSIGCLLFKPGWLTRAYILGQRQKYLSPINLFLLASLVFFLAPSLSDFNLTLGDQYNLQLYSGWVRIWVDELLIQSGKTFDQLESEYRLRSSEIAKLLVIVHVPLLGVASFILGLHKKLYLADHMVGALHFMAFLILYYSLIPITVIPFLDGINWLCNTQLPSWRIAVSIQFLYVPFMLRNAFGYIWVWVLIATGLYLFSLLGVHITYRFTQFLVTFITL